MKESVDWIPADTDVKMVASIAVEGKSIVLDWTFPFTDNYKETIIDMTFVPKGMPICYSNGDVEYGFADGDITIESDDTEPNTSITHADYYPYALQKEVLEQIRARLLALV